MAKIDLKYPKYCKITETEDSTTGVVSETLGTGAVFARAVKASFSFRTSKAKMYADGGLAESVNQFVEGSGSMDVDDLDDAIAADVTGQTSSNNEHTMTDESTAPYVRFSYIGIRIVRHVKKYTVICYYKLELDVPNDEYETKGETITLKPTSINATIAANCSGYVRTVKSFSTLADAVAYQNTFVNISTSSGSSSSSGTGTGA